MFLGEENSFEEDYGVNPYESFMRKHLQHYGYYTGKNQNYKNQFQQYAEWEKNYGYNLHGSSSEMDSDSDDDDDKHGDSKLQDDLRTTQLIYSYGESGKMVPRLREPRSLYALNKELGPQQAARWPSNLQVLNERVHHLQKLPAEPEPFYKTTGYEKCPMVRGKANGGRLVFNYETNASFFMKSRVGGSRNGCESCSIGLESEEDTTLIFESRFESGNLGKAVQVGDNDYEIWLRFDLYTNKHTQWFYFRVSNTRANRRYRFTIVNFMKPDSLYINGMQPLMYSEAEAAINKVGWVRGGQDIKYYKNNLTYEMNKTDRNFYSLTFTVELQHDHDTVYFSHCYPYTYTDLQDYLLELTNDPIKSRICKQRVLCRTLAGNLVYVLTITSASQNPEDIKHKKAVVVTARVHPGESNSSWMMKGFLDFVTGSSPDAKLLRDTFIIKVVPMLNPDGVIVGNYRCSLAGRDLNRNYKTSLKDAYPSVWHTKTMIRKLLQERDIIVYCDLHGHSRRQNVFIYGCEHRHGSNKRFHERVFPSMLNKNSPDKFCFHSCKFKVQKSKEGTGRVVMWNMGIMNSYTMEATFCGSSMGKKKGLHFNQNDYEMMGYHFCDTLLDYCDPDNTKYAKILVDLEHKHQMEIMTKIAEKGLEPEKVENMSDVSSDTESSDGGSDSSVSDGPPVHLQYAAARMLNDPKKKRLKSKRDRDRARVPGREELGKKVPMIQEDKRMRNNQVRPLKPEFTRNQAIRYTNTSPRRPRSHDDRSNSGIPVFVQERFDEKNQKRHDYLEALTAAYISNNIPLVNDPDEEKRPSTTPHQARVMSTATAEIWAGCDHSLQRQKSVVHFRYSGSSSDRPAQAQGQNLDGLCAHHEQILNAHYAAAQSENGADSNIDDIVKSQLGPSGSIYPLDRRPKPHLLEVSAAQQRQTDALSKDKNGPIKTHPNPFDEKAESGSGIKTDRSTASTSKNTPAATSYVNYNTFHVAQVKDPNNVDAQKGDRKEETQDKAKTQGKHKERSGRKSRKGMREDDERGNLDYESGQHSQTVFDVNEKSSTSQVPRIKSAHSSNEMTNTLNSIQQLQKSLQPDPSKGQSDNKEKFGNQSNEYATGEYIEKLIKETNDEIEGLTNEIQEDIEKKQYSQHKRKDRLAHFFFHKSKDHHKTKSTLVSESAPNVSDPRNLLNVGIHGGTFIADIEASREKGGYLGGKSVLPSSSMSQVGTKMPPPLPKAGDYLSYANSSCDKPIHPSQGLNLLVSSERQKETLLEEEARMRKIKKRNSPNSGSGSGSGSGMKKVATLSHTSIGGSVASQLVVSQPQPFNQQDFGKLPVAAISHEYMSQEDRQNSSGSISVQGNHSQNVSSVRLNKHNLVFRTPHSETGRVGTPREQMQSAEPHDGRGQEYGDGQESHTRSARSGCRQVIETVPTKISLMICNEQQETSPVSGQFLPLSRQGRPSRQGRRK